MAEPIHYGAPGTLPANKVSDWLANGSSRFGVIGQDSWKVTALPSVVRGIQFAPGAGWSDGILTTYDETNVPAPLELPVDTLSRWYMIVSRVNWMEPLTRTFVAIQSGGNKALPVGSVDYYREPGVIADFPVALVMVPGNSLNIGEIIDLRVWRGDAGWLMANSELVLQYLDRPGTVVEINGTLHRQRLGGGWDIVGRTDEANPMIFRSLVIAGEMNLPSGGYTTVWNMREHTSDRPVGITFSGGVATINVPGLYVMEGQVSFPGESSAADHGLRAVSFTVDPLGQKYLHRTYGDAGTSTRTVTATHTQYFAAGSKVALQAWQGTGKNRTIPNSVDGTRWNIRRVDR